MSLESYEKGTQSGQLYVQAEEYYRMTSQRAVRDPVEYRNESEVPRYGVKLANEHADYVVHNTDEDLSGAWVPISHNSVRAHDYLVRWTEKTDETEE